MKIKLKKNRINNDEHKIISILQSENIDTIILQIKNNDNNGNNNGNNNCNNNNKIVKTIKRYIDNYIKINLENCKIDVIFRIINKYFINDIYFSYSSINIILAYILTNKIKLTKLNLLNISEDFNINLFTEIIKLCYHNIKYSNVKCNHKFINLIINYLFFLLDDVSNLQSETKKNIYYLLDTNKILTKIFIILDSCNIYLDEYLLTKLIYIFHFINNIANLNTISQHIKLYISKFILSNNNLNFIGKKNINIKYVNNITKYIITYETYFEINIIKNNLFCKKNNKLHWCNKLYNLIKQIKDINIKKICEINKYNGLDVEIIDGRNTYYNNTISDKYNKLDLKNLTTNIINFKNNITFIIFNIKHINIIKNSVSNLLITLKNINIRTLKTKKYEIFTLTFKNNIILQKTIMFIFTPEYVDDDLMTIYLKLTYPTSKINTKDKYRKYLENFKSTNHYHYSLWQKIFN